MHFVTGGAFNGKKKWVKKNYEVSVWISAYEGKPILTDCSALSGDVVVIEGMEYWTKELAEKKSLTETREILRNVLERWHNWEKVAPERKMILIGTDIMKGIVPMRELDRNWRDVTGWFYQDIVRTCSRVDIIWYGIHQTIKGEK